MFVVSFVRLISCSNSCCFYVFIQFDKLLSGKASKTRLALISGIAFAKDMYVCFRRFYTERVKPHKEAQRESVLQHVFTWVFSVTYGC